MKPFLLSSVLIIVAVMSTMQLLAHEDKKSDKPKDEISSRNDIKIENKKERREKAEAAAKLFFEKLNKADLEGTLASAAVPFAWDKKFLLQDRDELKTYLKKVIDKKGARKSPELAIKVIDEKNSVINNCIPVSYYIVELKIKKSKAVLYFCVRPGDEYKVIGFTD